MDKQLAKNLVSFALANRTGIGFSGDLGYLDVATLATEAQLPYKDTKLVLDEMVDAGFALKDATDSYSGLPVQCVACGDDPCSCGIGTWR